MKRGIYPGSFDPITNGHLDLIQRAAKVMDELIVGILINPNKTPLFSKEERIQMIEQAVSHLNNVKVVSFEGMTVELADKLEADFLIRGVRTSTDFEMEQQLDYVNHHLKPNLDTIYFMTNPKWAHVSSSVVKELLSYNQDISSMVPEIVIKYVKKGN